MYYYNYIDIVVFYVCVEMMNFMGYDVGNMGNYDVEIGCVVFDCWIGECNFLVLGVNIVEMVMGEIYFFFYWVLECDGVKIVVLGMIMLVIFVWLLENLW